MIAQTLSYLIGTIVNILTRLSEFVIVGNVNLLNTLIVWDLIILVISLLNKLAKGSGNPKGKNETIVTRSGNVVNRPQKSSYEDALNAFNTAYKEK